MLDTPLLMVESDAAGTAGSEEEVREQGKRVRLLSDPVQKLETVEKDQEGLSAASKPESEEKPEVEIDSTEESREPVADIRLIMEKASELVGAGEFGHAKALLEDINLSQADDISSDDKFRFGELRLFLLLKINFFLVDYQQIVEIVPQYFKTYGNGQHYFLSYYYFAASLHQLKKPLQLVSLVTEEFFTNLTNRESQNLRSYLIEDALNKNQSLVAYNFILDSNGEVIEGFGQILSDIFRKIEDIEDINVILSENPTEHVKVLADRRKVQLLIRDGDYQAAQEFLNILMVSDQLDATALAELQGFQNFVEIALNTDPYKIGVILPLSHPRFGILARQALDGLELALQSRFRGDHAIQLIIKDSARKPPSDKNGKQASLTAEERSALVKRQVKDLVEKDRVIAILGPLAKNTSLVAGETAELYKVPVISFSITEKIGVEMPFLFRYQRNRIVEAENLAIYAMDYLQAERFVLFYTVDSSGKGFEVMQAFNRIVVENGGQIAGIAPIKYNQVDFKNSYMSMTGGFKKKTVEKEDGEKEEDPVIDFDLMFVPVPLNTLKIILDFNRSFDAEKVWVLSGSGINIKENQLLGHTRQLRFIDAFPIGSTSTFLQPFYENHWRSYNFRSDYRPPTNYTIYAYEALEIVAKLLNDPRYHNRESLKNAIQNLKGFPILTGSVNCDQNGELIKDLNILRIKGKKTIGMF
jgi:ABC-type branched-subunit amino acid transport system substrate-binding protein